jgi:hypothetical protein
MATYKLIQDIEAEDKILGPLSLRQFIFALIMSFFLYLCFIFVKNGLYFMLIGGLPPALFFGFFAFPFGRDQPTELWALGKLNYYFKPRIRIWNQSGVKELITITVPKKIEHIYTNGLSQNEVRSRLSALANTIDSRGWAVKNVDSSVYAPHHMTGPSSDRLIDISSIPQEVPGYEVVSADDILDESNNPIAQQFESMINRSTQEHRQQIINQMNSPAPATPVVTAQQATGAAEPWFINPPVPVTGEPAVQAVGDPNAEAVLSSELKAHAGATGASSNLRTLWPVDDQPAATVTTPVSPPVGTSAVDPAQAMTPTSDPAILALANNDDLNVTTLAREAQKAKQGDDEVVISLH